MIHHSVGKTMIVEQIAKTCVFVKKLGCPSGTMIFGGGTDDYLYCCPNSMETDVCHYMMDNVGFSKLEVGLSVMPLEDFLECLVYMHLKVDT